MFVDARTYVRTHARTDGGRMDIWDRLIRSTLSKSRPNNNTTTNNNNNNNTNANVYVAVTVAILRFTGLIWWTQIPH